MTIRYSKKKKFSKEELEWAISLVEAEFEKKERNTPEKMSEIIKNNFDVKCSPQDILNYFKINEDYERESKRIGSDYSFEHRLDQEGGTLY
jgi:hypothetical protein